MKMDELKYNPTDKEVDDILKLLVNNAVVEYEEDVKDIWELVKKRARQLLILNDIYIKFKKNMKNEKKFSKIEQELAQDQMHHAKMAQMCLLFQEALDAYLDAAPRKVIYVDVSSQGVPTLYEQELNTLANLVSNSLKLKTSKKDLINENKFNKEHLAKGKAAYQGTYNRLEQFKKHSKISQNMLLMWKVQNKWRVATVLNQGDFNEAYVKFLFSKHGARSDFLVNVNDLGKGPYYSHQLIGRFYKYIEGVSNLPSIVEEDVISEIDSYQYSVKGKNAETFGFGPYVLIARKIIDENLGGITKDEIRQAVGKETFRNRVVANLNNFSVTEMQKLINNNRFSKHGGGAIMEAFAMKDK